MSRNAGLLVLALALGGCSWFGGPDIEKPAELVDFEPSALISEVWSVDTGKGADRRYLRLEAVRNGSTIYVADTKGRVRALAKENGKERWQSDLGMEITGGVGFGDDLVLVGSRKGIVVALEAENGRERWRAQAASEILASPAANAGIVVVQSVDGQLAGLESKTGKRLWVLDRSEPPLSLRGTAAPVILSDAILTGFASGKIVAVNLKDGRLLWEIPVAQPQGRSEIERLIDVDVPVLIAGRILLAAAYQGKVVAIDLESGRLLWSREISTYSALAADADNVYASDASGNVIALSLHTGSTVWKQEKLKLRRLTAPVVTGKSVAVADFEGYVHWLAREDGRFLARERAARAAALVAPIADGETIYVSTQNGYLTALRIFDRAP